MPLVGLAKLDRRYAAVTRKPYDVRAIDYDLHAGSGRVLELRDRIGALMRQAPPSTWPGFSATLNQASQDTYPLPSKRLPPASSDTHWQHAQALRNLPTSIQATRDLIPDMKLKLVFVQRRL